MPKPKQKSKGSDLFIRLRSGAIYAACVLVGCLLGNIATMILIALAAGISSYEFYLMLRRDAKLPNETLGVVAAVAYPVCYYFFQAPGILFVTVVFIILLLIWYVFWRHARIVDVCISFFGAVYTGFSLTCLLAMRMAIPGDEIWGGFFAIFILTTISVNDGFAYLFGKAFGKHRLAPHISPKKTWEGFLPALVCSSALWLLLLIFPGVSIELWQCILYGLICGVAGVIGDLVESRMKRNSGVKDSGTLMPGHGGLLDRIDSIFLVSLIAALLLFTSGCIPF